MNPGRDKKQKIFGRHRRQSNADTIVTLNQGQPLLKKLDSMSQSQHKESRKSKYSNSSKLTKSGLLNCLSSSRIAKIKQKQIQLEVLDNAKGGLQVAQKGLEIKLSRLFGEQVGQIQRVLAQINKCQKLRY